MNETSPVSPSTPPNQRRYPTPPPDGPQWIALAAQYPLRWIVPAVLVAALAAGYALLRPDTWEASQAFIVRTEGATQLANGYAGSEAERQKSLQETVLELVRGRSVLAAVLRAAGPTKRRAETGFPTAQDIEDLREQVRIEPPKGAEFGTTDVFYLTVRAPSRKRATTLASALAETVDRHFREVRTAQTRQTVAELQRAVRLAREELAESTRQLKQFESSVGSDLAELRMLETNQSGESALRRSVAELRAAVRDAETRGRTSEQLLASLAQARRDPRQILATPNSLLQSQPALQRLKEGLIDAQIQLAQLRGKMSDEHPDVITARRARAEIEQQLREELDTAVEGLAVERSLAAADKDSLEDRLTATEKRLAELSAMRTEYASLLAEYRRKEDLVRRGEAELATARLQLASDSNGPLLRIGSPDTGAQPLGPGRVTIAAAGIVGGLFFGLAVFIWTVPAAPISAPRNDKENASADTQTQPASQPLSEPPPSTPWPTAPIPNEKPLDEPPTVTVPAGAFSEQPPAKSPVEAAATPASTVWPSGIADETPPADAEPFTLKSALLRLQHRRPDSHT